MIFSAQNQQLAFTTFGVVFLWLCVDGVNFYRGHHLFGMTLLMIGGYELTGPVMYWIVAQKPLYSQLTFQLYADGDELGGLMLALGIFLIVAQISYYMCTMLVSNKRPLQKVASESKKFNTYYFLALVVLGCGIISVYYEAGTVRLKDYQGEVLTTTPFYAYGSALLVPLAVVTVAAAIRNRWGVVFGMLMCAAPIVYELFISSRRQYLAPLGLVLILVVLYSSRVRRKWLIGLLVVSAMLVLMALQFQMRIAQVGYEGPSGIIAGVVAPQIGEFVVVGATTASAWSVFVLNDEEPYWGANWGFHALNLIPYLKVGNIYLPDYMEGLYAMYRRLAPNGGLSVIAESILTFGPLGILFAGVVIGCIFSYWHIVLARRLRGGIPLTAVGVYTISVVAISVLKYRSGIADAVQAGIYLAILFFPVCWIGRTLVLRRGSSEDSLRIKCDNLRSASDMRLREPAT